MPKKCPKHPKYDGRKEPDNECIDCLAWHLHVNRSKTRIPVKPSRSHKDESKYQRRLKHRMKYEEQ